MMLLILCIRDVDIKRVKIAGKFVLYFDEIDKGSLSSVGGKGANLGEMTKAGFPVPQGFCVTTSAYQAFIQISNDMSNFFTDLDRIDADCLNEIRLMGKQIRSHLESISIPDDIQSAILEAWQRFGQNKAYAVRSSATAEDLPTASFAGQQETYLNVRGQEQLLESVRSCWASLFTDRAISYRAKNGFDHRLVFLSVVVQEMIFPDISGIMFTANPITGNRKVTSIDASFGLGEALVSGLVSADLYQVRDSKIIEKKISNKKLAIYAVPEGGTVTKDLLPEQQKVQALPDERIIELAELGRKIEGHYGSEQDIEWCFADERFYIVQSRPITSLYPIPSFSDNQLHVLISIGHIQMMTEEMKPLGISIFQTAIPIALEAGGRVFADITPMLSIKLLRKKLPLALRHMDDQLGAALEEVVDRYTSQFPSKRIPIRKITSFARPIIKIIIKNLFVNDPEQGRTIVTNLVDKSVQSCRESMLETSDPMRIGAIKNDLRNVISSDLPKVVPYWVTSIFALNIVKYLLQKWIGDSEKIHLLERSLPGNITSELGLVIGDLADIVRQSPELIGYLQTRTDDNFYDGLDDISGGYAFRQGMELFMRSYGMRCPGEIDISKPRWREMPTTLVSAIMSHVRTVAPREHRDKFRQGAMEAEEAAREIVAQVLKNKGAFKARIIKRLIYVYRNLGGLREHHKYLVVQHFDIYRKVITDEAKMFIKTGVLSQETDIFYLTMDELNTVASGNLKQNVTPLMEERKKQLELNKKLIPPRVMTSEGEIITGRRRTVKAPEGSLIGTPVSAGIVEGYARVVLHPEEAKLNLGEIMIAPFTDPGWTPLFHSAKGLVMEIGGMMTHGAVIAREYGIPSVVGIDDATVIIKNGDYIRVNGTKGYVEVLKKSETPTS
ncbi:probable pyruvate, water dikinase [Candidatus Desulfosporosinus infrequens]|uniref:Probable pyruvate, water dikinase n=1 Tax=Candidatus Desulfosporosinus infrequens TaxID=2043169 RepID=A0A2U3KDR6_9FIRM|nr:probable pyruvate, water dikinase [Candidatus Desulfosporosinus infrequens]